MSEHTEPTLSRARSRKSPNTPKPAKRARIGGWRKELWDWTKALAVAFAIVLVLRAFVFQLSTVKSYSMQPTLFEKEWLFINKAAYEFGKPNRGDVVILKDPSDGPDRKQYLVKRVVGVPGDTLEIRAGLLYLNGQLTVEPYTDSPIEDGDFAPVTVSPGHYFVMGDNRRKDASRDSRKFNEVPEGDIKGRGDFIIWPISRWDKL